MNMQKIKMTFVLLCITISSPSYSGGSGNTGGLEEAMLASIREEVMLMERSIPTDSLDNTLLDNNDLVIMTAAKKLSLHKSGKPNAFKIDWEKKIVEIQDESVTFSEIINATK